MTNSLSLLIIEDSVSDAKLVLRQVRQAGYELTSERVDTAQDLKTALDTKTWDIVISDYSMPGFNGIEALQILRSMKKDIPFIMTSGVMGEEQAVEAMRAGAQDYVMKDKLQRLVPAIERELREVKERQARREAESQVNLLSEALAQSASLVLMTNMKGIIEYANSSFYQVSGYDSDKVVGQCVQDIINIDDQIWDEMSLQSTFQGEILNQRKSGEDYWVSLNITPVQDTDGVTRRCLILQEDITERKMLELELQHYAHELEAMVAERTSELSDNNKLLREEIAERKQIESQLAVARDKALEALQLKNAILANLNHDVQTPLSIISLSVQIIKRKLEAGKTENLMRHLGKVIRETQQLSDFFKQFLSLADVRAIGINNATFSPASLLKDSLAAMRPLAEKKNLVLEGHVDNLPEVLYGDFDRLYQILVNLISNAIQFTDNGHIQVDFKQHDTLWSMTVIDTGRGILPEDQARIFDLFWQVDMSSSRDTSRGSGLGLAVAKQYTGMMDGHISIESDGKSGSTFTVQLPLLDQKA